MLTVNIITFLFFTLGHGAERTEIYSRISALNDAEKNDWTTFIISSRIRTPEHIKEIKSTTPKTFEDILDTDPHEYESTKNEEHPDTLTEYVKKEYPNLIENTAMLLLPELIFDDVGKMKDVRNKILDMRWWVIDLSDATVDLLTSDNPCVIINEIEKPNSLIYVPLNPQLAFFASPSTEMINRLLRNGKNKLARLCNETVVTKAKKYIYALGDSKDSHKIFIQRRLLKANNQKQ